MQALGRPRHEAEPDTHAPGEIGVDEHESVQHQFDDGLHVDVAEFEGERIDDVILLRFGHRLPEHRRLAVGVVRSAVADLGAGDDSRNVDVSAVCLTGDERATTSDDIGQIGGSAGVNGLLMGAVTMIVIDRGERSVDRDLFEVWSAV